MLSTMVLLLAQQRSSIVAAVRQRYCCCHSRRSSNNVAAAAAEGSCSSVGCDGGGRRRNMTALSVACKVPAGVAASCFTGSAPSSSGRWWSERRNDATANFRATTASAATTKRFHYSYSGPGSYYNDVDSRDETMLSLWRSRDFYHRGFTVGIGGPVRTVPDNGLLFSSARLSFDSARLSFALHNYRSGAARRRSCCSYVESYNNNNNNNSLISREVSNWLS